MPRSQIDVRTRTMTSQALTCRTFGHAPQPIPVPARRRTELRQLGQYAIRAVCLRGCTRWWENLYDLDTDELVASRNGYLDKEGYLIHERGSGRLPRTSARAAWKKVVGMPKAVPAGLPEFPEPA